MKGYGIIRPHDVDRDNPSTDGQVFDLLEFSYAFGLTNIGNTFMICHATRTSLHLWSQDLQSQLNRRSSELCLTS